MKNYIVRLELDSHSYMGINKPKKKRILITCLIADGESLEDFIQSVYGSWYNIEILKKTMNENLFVSDNFIKQRMILMLEEEIK